MLTSGVLDGDAGAGGRRPGRERQPRRHAPRRREIGLADGALGCRDDRGTTAVGLLADADVERQLPEQCDAVLGGHAGAAAGAEDRLLVPAVGADVRAHVLDHAEHGNRDFLEHPEALAGVEQRDVLRGRDDHRPAHRDALGQRELDVAGAGRHVDDEVVEFAPVGVAEQLRERLRDHRAAPDHRLLLLDQEPDRHDLDAVRLERLDAPAVPARGPVALQARHARLAGTVDVGIEEPHARPVERKREREVDGRRRLADAALARGHCDDVADARQRREPALHGLGLDGPGHGHPRGSHPGDGSQPLLEPRGEFRAVAAGREAEYHLDLDPAGPGVDGLHSFRLPERHPEVGFDIILDHQAGFADAIVGHGSAATSNGEYGMSRGRQIVAESRRGLADAGASGAGLVAWHTSASPRRHLLTSEAAVSRAVG
jgi:hypothetical protein